jgi:glycerol-1-phosphate dehydrogenase [NAD(P)+]
LISHYIDMTAHAFGLPHDFHGCQVGVGTLTTAHFYERFRALDPSSIDIDARIASLADWPAQEALLRERFGPLFEAVVKHARPAYPSPEILRARLQKIVDEWGALSDEIGVTLRTRQSLEDELLAAGCPTRFRDLDVERARAREAIVWSKDIRNRYTILHAAWELGFLEQWADEALELLFE